MTTISAPTTLLLRARDWVLVPAPADPLSPVARRAFSVARRMTSLADETLARDLVVGEPLDPAVAKLSAHELLRDALRWTLVARSPTLGLSEALDALPDDVSPGVSREALRAALTREASELLSNGSTLDADLALLRGAAAALGAGLSGRASSASHRWITRALRATVLAVALAGAVVIASIVVRESRPELAETARWTASSAAMDYATQGVGFHPFEGRPNVFIWTRVEAAPWVEFDLGSPREIRTVWVQNRLDDHYEWAIPLVAEVSNDRRRWTEVGRRVETFYTWRASFPATRVRYVRLIVPRATELHLGRVEIR